MFNALRMDKQIASEAFKVEILMSALTDISLNGAKRNLVASSKFAYFVARSALKV